MLVGGKRPVRGSISLPNVHAAINLDTQRQTKWTYVDRQMVTMHEAGALNFLPAFGPIVAEVRNSERLCPT